jgi:hypothetical protein
VSFSDDNGELHSSSAKCSEVQAYSEDLASILSTIGKDVIKREVVVLKIFANNLLAFVGLTLLLIGNAEAGNAFVDLALYRPSTGQFFIRSSVNGSVVDISFGGVPGDQGLLCKWFSNTISGGDNLLVFRNEFGNGVFYINAAADGARVDISFGNGVSTDQPLCGSYEANGEGRTGVFRNGAWFLHKCCGFGTGAPTFFFGNTGDVAVHIGARGYGNTTDRQNMIYGVYRAGTWYLDETGSGVPTRIVYFGGLSQDVPLLIPQWRGGEPYSLAIYRDGIWHILSDINTPSSVVTVPFGAIGDIPLVRGAH